MLRVLNARERNNAFLQFVLFFVLTTALIVGVIYFDFRLPLTEIKHLREEVSVQQLQNQNQINFVAKMDEARIYLDSLERNPTASRIISIKLDEVIKQMTQLQLIDGSAYGKMNATIVETFVQLQHERIELINASQEKRNISMLESQLEQCKRDLDHFRLASGTGQQ
jgi:hypothetical protein